VYAFRVAAISAVGTSPLSTASAETVPATVPTPPIRLSVADVGDGSVTIAFEPPVSSGGAEIEFYTLFANLFVAPDALGGAGNENSNSNGIDDGNSNGNGDANGDGSNVVVRPSTTALQSPITLSGLPNGASRTFTVRAHNKAGVSVESEPSQFVTPFTTPDAPRVTGAGVVVGTLSGGTGSGAIRVAFAPPAFSGGAQILHFVVTARPASADVDDVGGGDYADGDSVSVVATSSPVVISGLRYGQVGVIYAACCCQSLLAYAARCYQSLLAYTVCCCQSLLALHSRFIPPLFPTSPGDWHAARCCQS
jgi:hypothetical protein